MHINVHRHTHTQKVLEVCIARYRCLLWTVVVQVWVIYIAWCEVI